MPQLSPDFCPNYAPTMPQLCLNYAPTIFAIFLAFLGELCPNYAPTMLQLCPTQLCPNYTFCPTMARPCPEFCPSYAPTMPQLCFGRLPNCWSFLHLCYLSFNMNSVKNTFWTEKWKRRATRLLYTLMANVGPRPLPLCEQKGAISNQGRATFFASFLPKFFAHHRQKFCKKCTFWLWNIKSSSLELIKTHHAQAIFFKLVVCWIS